MTPPDTNTQEQRRRHWPVILGIAAVVVFGVGIILYWLGEEVVQVPEQPDAASEAPSAEDVQEGEVDPAPGVPERTADPEVENPGTPEL